MAIESILRNLGVLAGEPDPWLAIHPEVQSGVEAILTRHVLPHATHTSRILDVGFGMRPEELLAILNILNPDELAAIEPGRLGDIGFPKWKRYLHTLDTQARRGITQRITLSHDDVININNGPFDVVCAFSIAPTLQTESDIQTLLSLSDGFVVITANNQNKFRFGDYSEAEHIDHLLPDSIGNVIVRMESVDEATKDGHIWVIQTKQ